MKKVIQISVTVVVLLVPVILLAQPMPYDQSIGGGSGSYPVGGGAPLGEGIILLLTMGVGYGIRKYRQIRKMI
jgi:preprotein translocase subunit SecG